MPFMIKVVQIMNEGNKNGKSIKLRQKISNKIFAIIQMHIFL